MANKTSIPRRAHTRVRAYTQFPPPRKRSATSSLSHCAGARCIHAAWHNANISRTPREFPGQLILAVGNGVRGYKLDLAGMRRYYTTARIYIYKLGCARTTQGSEFPPSPTSALSSGAAHCDADALECFPIARDQLTRCCQLPRARFAAWVCISIGFVHASSCVCVCPSRGRVYLLGDTLDCLFLSLISPCGGLLFLIDRSCRLNYTPWGQRFLGKNRPRSITSHRFARIRREKFHCEYIYTQVEGDWCWTRGFRPIEFSEVVQIETIGAPIRGASRCAVR